MADRSKLSAQEETLPSGRKYKVRRRSGGEQPKRKDEAKTKVRQPVSARATGEGDVPTK